MKTSSRWLWHADSEVLLHSPCLLRLMPLRNRLVVSVGKTRNWLLTKRLGRRSWG